MASRTAAIIGVPLDLGAGRRGVDMGPSAFRVAELDATIAALGYEVKDLGDLRAAIPETQGSGDPHLKYLKEIKEVCEALRDRVYEARKKGQVPLVLGGDHSIAMGSVAATALHHRRQERPIGLLWIDAHTDINTPETSLSGNLHGMPLAHLLGLGSPALRALAGDAPAVRPEHVAVLGVRSVDAGERETVKRLGVRVYSMSEIDERGFPDCLKEALARVTGGTAGFHLSFDLDAVDPRYAPGTGTPVPGGLTYREAHFACESAARSGVLLALDMVELNPTLDEHNRTGKLAVELILSALGKTIL